MSRLRWPLVGRACALAALAVLAAGLRAEDKPDDAKLPAAKEIVARHLKAIGGKEAVLKHFGVFRDDNDLEERLADARARREAGG